MGAPFFVETHDRVSLRWNRANSVLLFRAVVGMSRAASVFVYHVRCVVSALMKQFWNNVPSIRNVISPTPKGWYIIGTVCKPVYEMGRAVMEPQRGDT